MFVTWRHRSQLRNEIVYHIIIGDKTACAARIRDNWHIAKYNPAQHNDKLCARCMFSSALIDHGIFLNAV